MIDLRHYRPASVLVMDLVGHASRGTEDADRIQSLVERAFSEAIAALRILDVQIKYTGDGYFCTFLGDDSVRIMDFLNTIIPKLGIGLSSYNQAYRMGFDFGLLHLKENALTHTNEHFDLPGILAARLEKIAAHNQVLCTERAHALFQPRYPHMFANSPILAKTKDRELRVYSVSPIDFTAIRQLVTEFVYRKPSTSLVTPLGRNRILVVDDQPMMVQIITRMCSAPDIKRFLPEDLDIIGVTDAEEALRIFTPSTCALVILDLVLPNISGIELTRRLLNLDPETPVVMVTGYPSEEDAAEFFEAGGLCFVDKPFDVADLIETLSFAVQWEQRSLWKSFRILSDHPGKLVWMLERVSTRLRVAMTKPRTDDMILQLLRHKIRRMTDAFISSIQSGNDVLPGTQALVNQLESFIRWSRIASSAVDEGIIAFVKEYAKDIEHLNPEVHVTLAIDEGEFRSNMYREITSLLALIICELMDNSIAATEGKGRIHVMLGVLKSIGALSVVVQDNGCGVVPEIQPELFNHGVTTKGPGRGLGLHLIHTAIKKCGGLIKYQTSDGARFSIQLPYSEVK